MQLEAPLQLGGRGLHVEPARAVEHVVEQHHHLRRGTPRVRLQRLLRLHRHQQLLQFVAGRTAVQLDVHPGEDQSVHAFDVYFIVDVYEDRIVVGLQVHFVLDQEVLIDHFNYFVILYGYFFVK